MKMTRGMKKLSLVLAGGLMAAALAACGGSKTENTGSATATINDYVVSDHITLGEYKGVHYTLVQPEEVTDEMIQEELDAFVAEGDKEVITDRPAASGDTANIDYEGKLDGVAFEGGTAQGYDLVLGSGKFIPGFEDQVIGHNTGETFDINVSFPDPYINNPDLAGKPVVFTVTINEIFQVKDAELTDAFVAANSEYETIEEMKAGIRAYLEEEAQADADDSNEYAIIDAVLANATIKDLPQSLYEKYNQRFKSYYETMASYYGSALEDLITQGYGLDMEEFEASADNYANSMSEQVLAMQAVAEAEGLTITDEEYQAELEEYYKTQGSGYDSIEAFEKAVDSDSIRIQLLYEKVLPFLKENAIAD